MVFKGMNNRAQFSKSHDEGNKSSSMNFTKINFISVIFGFIHFFGSCL